jgi:hypothetical protein
MTGARAIVVILWILCAAACGARAPVAKAAGPPQADDGWTRFGLASDGMSAMFSTIPEEGWWESTESEVRGLLAGEENGLQLIMQSYRHRSIIEQVVTEESLAGWLDGLVPHAERREEIKQGELLGRSIEGTDAKGRWCNARASPAASNLRIGRRPFHLGRPYFGKRAQAFCARTRRGLRHVLHRSVRRAALRVRMFLSGERSHEGIGARAGARTDDPEPYDPCECDSVRQALGPHHPRCQRPRVRGSLGAPNRRRGAT